jgi:hypothetical protein
MRTTIEITPEQHQALNLLARYRGFRGFSKLVQEALDSYLQDQSSDEVDRLLGLEGSIDGSQEQELRSRIEEARGTWRVS